MNNKLKQTLPVFEYNKEDGIATCILTDGKNVFVGVAQCHPEDQDMENEKTGSQIALYRAEIHYLNHVKNNEIKPALKALYQVYYTMKHSLKFNPASYENKMLWKQINLYESDLLIIKTMLKNKREELKKYIDDKDLFYRRIRANREMAKME